MVPDLRDLTYEDRLTEMELPTLQSRRERGDLVMMYKIISGKEKIDIENLVVLSENRDSNRKTRGHSKKIEKSHCTGDVKKYSFPHKTVDIWNELSEEVVTSASIHVFKERLDRYRYGDKTK